MLIILAKRAIFLYSISYRMTKLPTKRFRAAEHRFFRKLIANELMDFYDISAQYLLYADLIHGRHSILPYASC